MITKKRFQNGSFSSRFCAGKMGLCSFLGRFELAIKKTRGAALIGTVLWIVACCAAGQETPKDQPGAPDQPQSQSQSPSRPEGASPPKAEAKAKAKTHAKHRASRRDRPGFYMGRLIADVMSWQGAEWLFRQTRVREEQPSAMLDALKIPEGATVADVGAGAGYHTINLARRVGPEGTVYATDLQVEMLRMLRENARRAGVKNIKPLRCTQDDPRLPANAIDLILMVDVYHECSNPRATLRGLLAALKPGGRLVLVEFRGEDPDVPIKPEHKMTLAQVKREVEPCGFHFKESLEFLPWQHVIIFEKPKGARGPSGPGEETKEPSKAKTKSKVENGPERGNP